MNLITNIAPFLIGSSFSLLLFNPIAFGVALIIGILVLLISYRKDLIIGIKPDKGISHSALVNGIVLTQLEVNTPMHGTFLQSLSLLNLSK